MAKPLKGERVYTFLHQERARMVREGHPLAPVFLAEMELVESTLVGFALMQGWLNAPITSKELAGLYACWLDPADRPTSQSLASTLKVDPRVRRTPGANKWNASQWEAIEHVVTAQEQRELDAARDTQEREAREAALFGDAPRF